MTAFLQVYQAGISKEQIFPLINQACEFLESQGMKDTGIGHFRLALEELLMNVFHHSGLGEEDTVEVTLSFDGDSLQLQVRDHGIAFNPLTEPEPDTSLDHDERPIGGLGINLVRKTSDRINYRRDAEGNVTEVAWMIDKDQ